MMRPKLFQMLIVLALASCTQKKAGTDAVYADYMINGEEGGATITCLFKFFTNRRDGSTLALEPPAGVWLDGETIAGDSARLSGSFYEMQKPLASFGGTHTIVFKNAEGRAYHESFSFQPFSLATELSGTVPRADIELQLEGLQATDYIRVLLIDTSFASPDINDVDTVTASRLVIRKEALKNVASGPVTLQLFKEVECPLKQAPAGGGKLAITYSLSREFELVD